MHSNKYIIYVLAFIAVIVLIFRGTDLNNKRTSCITNVYGNTQLNMINNQFEKDKNYEIDNLIYKGTKENEPINIIFTIPEFGVNLNALMNTHKKKNNKYKKRKRSGKMKKS